MKRADLWTADVFIVDDINCVTTAGHLDSTSMWSMVLGKRLATPSYLSSAKKDRLVSSSSIKYKAAYTLKEVGWWLTADFMKKDRRFVDTLKKTCQQDGSKWRVLDQETCERWHKTKALAAKVATIDSMKDFHTHIRELATVDTFSTSRGILAKASSSKGCSSKG